jgi:hypothetical protein
VRLSVVEHGHRFKKKLVLRLVRFLSGYPAPDVVKTLFYRSEFFGEPHSKLTQLAMRGRSAWSVGERELFAAYVSSLNQCVF